MAGARAPHVWFLSVGHTFTLALELPLAEREQHAASLHHDNLPGYVFAERLRVVLLSAE